MERIITFPCNTGETLFIDKRILNLPYGYMYTWKIVECEVVSLIVTKKQKLIKIKPYGLDCYIGRASQKRIAASSIGKTVFLTREAAEQALKAGVPT